MKCKCFEPIIDKNSKILILGTMPGNISLENSKKSNKPDYYSNFSKNQFWKIIAKVFNADFENIKKGDYKKRINLLLKNGIALWDIIKKCEREETSSDRDIKEKTIKYNNIEAKIKKYNNIKTIITNGKGFAFEHFRKGIGHFREIKGMTPPSLKHNKNKFGTYYTWNEIEVYPLHATINYISDKEKQRWVDLIKEKCIKQPRKK